MSKIEPDFCEDCWEYCAAIGSLRHTSEGWLCKECVSRRLESLCPACVNPSNLKAENAALRDALSLLEELVGELRSENAELREENRRLLEHWPTISDQEEEVYGVITRELTGTSVTYHVISTYLDIAGKSDGFIDKAIAVNHAIQVKQAADAAGGE